MSSLIQLIPYLLGLAVGLGVFYFFYLQNKHKKAVIGHIYATFYTETGADYRELCRVEGNKVEAPLPSLKRHPRLKGYLISAIKSFNGTYPPNWPRILQAEVSTTAYYEGDPNPIVSRDPNDRQTPLLTPELLIQLRNDPSGEMLSKEVKDWMNEGRNKTQGPLLSYIIGGVSLILLIVILVNQVDLATMIQRLSRLWGM